MIRYVVGIVLILSVTTLTQAQISISFDSIAGQLWENLTFDHATVLYSEQPQISEGPPGRAYLLGGPCIMIPGYSYITYPEAGVQLIFSPPDSSGQHRLKSVSVSKRGAITTRNGVDIGDEIKAVESSDGTPPRPAVLYGRNYVHVFDKGTFYYCTPSSLKRAKKGKSVKVIYIVLREHF